MGRGGNNEQTGMAEYVFDDQLLRDMQRVTCLCLCVSFKRTEDS
jgi:hypothetical protein